jgi:hypothetical protein
VLLCDRFSVEANVEVVVFRSERLVNFVGVGKEKIGVLMFDTSTDFSVGNVVVRDDIATAESLVSDDTSSYITAVRLLKFKVVVRRLKLVVGLLCCAQKSKLVGSWANKEITLKAEWEESVSEFVVI